jgi:hypothetical protein
MGEYRAHPAPKRYQSALVKHRQQVRCRKVATARTTQRRAKR